jgi:beta-glucosidase/6-phospho-beta-glucosidase/beta-galactosidase
VVSDVRERVQDFRITFALYVKKIFISRVCYCVTRNELNIMHMTVNFLELFFPDRQNIFQSDKIFMSVSPND